MNSISNDRDDCYGWRDFPLRWCTIRNLSPIGKLENSPFSVRYGLQKKTPSRRSTPLQRDIPSSPMWKVLSHSDIKLPFEFAVLCCVSGCVGVRLRQRDRKSVV